MVVAIVLCDLENPNSCKGDRRTTWEAAKYPQLLSMEVANQKKRKSHSKPPSIWKEGFSHFIKHPCRIQLIPTRLEEQLAVLCAWCFASLVRRNATFLYIAFAKIRGPLA